jgi:hypothetical protein
MKTTIPVEVNDYEIPEPDPGTYSTAEGRAKRERVRHERYLNAWRQVAATAASKVKELEGLIHLCHRIEGQ